MLLPCRCGIGFCLDLAGRSFPYVEIARVLGREKEDICMAFRTSEGVNSLLENKITRPTFGRRFVILEDKMDSYGVEKTEKGIQERIYIPSPPPTPSSDDVSQRTHHRHHMDRKHHLLSEVKTSCLVIIASYHPCIYLSYAHPMQKK
jgi:hypothetical protein